MGAGVARPAPCIAVVGSINVDLVVRADALPGPGETVVGPRLERFGGGKGANAAVAIARLGHAVDFIGAVGDDALGVEARQQLEADGVGTTHLAVVEDEATGAALIVVDAGGENQIAVGAGANAAVAAEHVRSALCSLRPTCVLVSMEVPFAAVAAAVASAAEGGFPAIVNPAPAVAEVLSLADLRPILTPNAREAATLTGLDQAPAAAAALAARTRAPAVVTAGADGAYVARPGGTPVRLPAVAGIVVRDTTGAGDTFNGALAARIAQGADPIAAARFGVAAAACAVGRDGARSGMPTAAEVDALLGHPA